VRLADQNSRFLLLIDLELSVQSNSDRTDTSIRWYSATELKELGLDPVDAIFLGLDQNGSCCFAADFWRAKTPSLDQGLDRVEPLVDLWSLALQAALSPQDLAIVGEARALSAWHQVHRCCGRCGAHTRRRDGGWKRQCWACQQSYFPRSDPAVIMLISHGERCLLGRHNRFRPNFYSVLAGFVEPGEDIEDAVRRETLEEAGVEVGQVDYVGSQPWPFPHSLMIGCRGEALTTDLKPDETELEDVRWVEREDVKRMLADEHAEGLIVPGRLSIAHFLIRQFAEA
jgi:NAD+ diphosphatase